MLEDNKIKREPVEAVILANDTNSFNFPQFDALK